MSKPTDGIVRCRRCSRRMIAEEAEGHDCSKLTITRRSEIIECTDAFFSETQAGPLIHIIDLAGTWYRFRLPEEVAKSLAKRR